jgi:hypothetical protein
MSTKTTEFREFGIKTQRRLSNEHTQCPVDSNTLPKNFWETLEKARGSFARSAFYFKHAVMFCRVM